MEHYRGLTRDDRIDRGGSYVRDRGYGHEVCNFVDCNGMFYGYVRAPGKTITIERLGAGSKESHASDVTVIWTATRPTGGTAIVGWYRNATVFRHYQRFDPAPTLHERNGVEGYWVMAPSNQGTLLSVDERTYEILRRVKGGMGQSNIWYADTADSRSLVEGVLEFVNGRRAAAVNDRGRKSKQDQERKAQIENAAIRMCRDHYEKIGYVVKSVERDNTGWDLEAQLGKTMLRIEVKGLSGSRVAAELTPNEYVAFRERSAGYRLGIVINALDEPILIICRYSDEQERWVVEGDMGKSVQIEVRKSASIRCI